MPKKGKKGGKKKKAVSHEPPPPQTGPLFADAQIDPVKGGVVRATRMGRSYELSVPIGATEQPVVVNMRVKEYDGGTPSEFRLDGRIVSNRVELEPPNLTFTRPALLRIPHFCADPKGESAMFVAGLWEAEVPMGSPDDETTEEQQQQEDEPLVFKKIPGGSFNIGSGFSTVEVYHTGTYYVCSSIADGIDYAVTQYKIPIIPAGGEFNTVAFDWVPGNLHLWTRTSLDRPVGMDGPVFIGRKKRLKVDFEAKKLTKGGHPGVNTYEETFILPDSGMNLMTGLQMAQLPDRKTQQMDEPFEALYFEVMVVPPQSSQLLIEAQEKLDQALQDVKTAEEHALATGRHLDMEERTQYMKRVQEAKNVLKEMQEQYLPWSEKKNSAHAGEKSASGNEEAADQDVQENVEDLPTQQEPQDHSAVEAKSAPGNKQDAGTVPAAQSYKDLPVWNGKNQIVQFGVRMIPSSGFQEDHLVSEISIVIADNTGEERRLLEIPEMPGQTGKVRKVWVGPPKEKIFTFTPVLTRASYAELYVHVQLGAWTKTCVITLSTGSHTLEDVRRIVTSHCFGRDLSEARFVTAAEKIIEHTEEARVRAQTLRPTVGLWGSARRQGVYSKSKVLMSYTIEFKDVVTQIHDSLKVRGFPVVLDHLCTQSGVQDLSEAALMICLLSQNYNDNKEEEYMAAENRSIAKLHVWASKFDPTGWLKKALKTAIQGDKYPPYKATDLPGGGAFRLTAQQLDDLAISVGDALPAPDAPVVFKKKMPAPYAQPPPVGPAEWARLNPVKLNVDTLQPLASPRKGQKSPKSPAKKKK